MSEGNFEEDFAGGDFAEELFNSRLTVEGARQMLGFLSEFCHGFNIDEIADINNIDSDDIRVMIMVLCTQAGIVNDDTMIENKEAVDE